MQSAEQKQLISPESPAFHESSEAEKISPERQALDLAFAEFLSRFIATRQHFEKLISDLEPRIEATGRIAIENAITVLQGMQKASPLQEGWSLPNHGDRNPTDLITYLFNLATTGPIYQAEQLAKELQRYKSMVEAIEKYIAYLQAEYKRLTAITIKVNIFSSLDEMQQLQILHALNEIALYGLHTHLDELKPLYINYDLYKQVEKDATLRHYGLEKFVKIISPYLLQQIIEFLLPVTQSLDEEVADLVKKLPFSYCSAAVLCKLLDENVFSDANLAEIKSMGIDRDRLNKKIKFVDWQPIIPYDLTLSG